MTHFAKKLLVQFFALFMSVLVVLNLTLNVAVSAGPYTKLEALFHPYYNPVCETSAAASPVTSTAVSGGSSVYLLGDSITARSATTYSKMLTDKGSSATISARVGRSWTSPGQNDNANTGTQGTGKDAVKADAEAIKNAGIIVVALGTNGLASQNPIDEMISTLKAINGTAQIYWVNVAIIGNGGVAGFNNQLASAAGAGKIKLIDWAKTVDPSGDGTHDPSNVLEHDSVNAHPTIPDGVNKLVNLVVGALGQSGSSQGGQSNNSVCCGPKQNTNDSNTPSGDTIDLTYKDAGRNNRSVGATVYLPSTGGPWPLVMFAPGRDVNSKANDPNGIYKRYLSAIASQGYLVVGANFSDNNSAAAVPNEVEDIKFLITQVQQEGKLQGKINTSSGIALIGHSDGGMVATSAGYGSNKDSRLTAVIAENGVSGLGSVGPPLLLMVGSNDGGNLGSVQSGFQASQASYTAIATFKGASHFHYITGPARGDNNTSEDSFHQAVDNITGVFLKRMLNKDTSDATNLGKFISKNYSSQVTITEKGNDTVVGGTGTGATTASVTTTECCPTGAGSTVSGGDPPAIVWNFLVGEMKLSAPQAAGIMGNIDKESSFSTTSVNPRNGAYGLVQWFSGRLTSLQAFAEKNGKDKSDIGLQLQFMKIELEGSYYKPRVLDKIKATNDMAAAVRIWLENFEIPCAPPGAACDPEFRDRFPRAQKYLTLFGSNTGTSVDASGSSGTVSGGCSSGSSPGEYKNPLRDVQNLAPRRVDQGVDYSGDGPVYAIGNGVVVLVKNGTSAWPGGHWISYKLTDGPAAGKTVFVAENCTDMTLSAGDKIDASTKLCTMHNSYPFIETGWAVDQPADWALAHTYYHESDVTAHGVNFDQLMQKLGAPAGTQSRPAIGELPSDWPKW